MFQLDRSCAHKTYYEILSVKEDASYDEIRASYKLAALSSHPDKQNTGNVSCLSFEHKRFLEVQKAWEVLSNSKSRAIYDRELSASKLDFIVTDEINLGEMMIEKTDATLELLHPCRCGDFYTISFSELQEMGFCLNGNGVLELEAPESKLNLTSIIIPCPSCSLKISLITSASS